MAAASLSSRPLPVHPFFQPLLLEEGWEKCPAARFVAGSGNSFCSGTVLSASSVPWDRGQGAGPCLALSLSKIHAPIPSLPSKQPLVGHNMMMDLLHLHEKFFRPLPGECI